MQSFACCCRAEIFCNVAAIEPKCIEDALNLIFIKFIFKIKDRVVLKGQQVRMCFDDAFFKIGCSGIIIVLKPAAPFIKKVY